MTYLGSVKLCVETFNIGLNPPQKGQFLLQFSTIYAVIGWMGESEKDQKCADLI